MSDRRNSSFTPNMKTPSGNKRGKRVIFGIILAILLPIIIIEAIAKASSGVLWLTMAAAAICVLVLWRESIFKMRGRMVMTGLALLEMIILISTMLPSTAVRTELPVSVVPAAVTVAPDDSSISTLTNIGAVLYQQEQLDDTGEVVYQNEEEADAAHRAEQEAILDTTVYSVLNGARFYHSGTVCGTQSNRRTLTVREAIAEGMGACPDCNPPVYTG